MFKEKGRRAMRGGSRNNCFKFYRKRQKGNGVVAGGKLFAFVFNGETAAHLYGLGDDAEE